MVRFSSQEFVLFPFSINPIQKKNISPTNRRITNQSKQKIHGEENINEKPKVELSTHLRRAVQEPKKLHSEAHDQQDDGKKKE